MILLLDTNIIMDALQERSPFDIPAKEILMRGQSGESTCLFTASAAADIWSRKECVDVFKEMYCYDDQLKYEGREEGREEGLALSTQIYGELKENVPIPTIAEKYGVTIRQIEKMKEVFAV